MPLLDHIEAALRPLADPAQAAPMRAYMLGQFAFLGVRAPPRRQALRGLPGLAGLSGEDLLALARDLWALPEREFRYVAIDLLTRYRRQLGPAHLPDLQWLVLQQPWWDTVDGLAGVVGEVVLHARDSQPGVQRHMDDWLEHDSLWVRRVAMLHQLGWKARTDEERLQRYALALAPEKDFFIRKAIGWALRDHARTRPGWVQALLQEHGSRFSGLTRREAAKHLG